MQNIIPRYYKWKLTTLSKVNEVITVLLTMFRYVWHLICVLTYYDLASLMHAFHLRNEVWWITRGHQNSFTTTMGRSAVPGGQYRDDARCRGRRQKQTHTEEGRTVMKEFRNITGTGQSHVQLFYLTALNWDAVKVYLCYSSLTARLCNLKENRSVQTATYGV